MENLSGLGEEEDQMELHPGFRFNPTDEELITQYLSKKVLDATFTARAIGEVDLNKVEPWDLPWKAKMGEKEWYFFCARDKKYPTGLRTNRATDAGYWKATGKDKEIFQGKSLVGMKKTLVFYRGRAPKAKRTHWVMNEYRLVGKFSLQYLPKTAKNEFVICKVFLKSSGKKKIDTSGTVRVNSVGNELGPVLPPLMDHSPYGKELGPVLPPLMDYTSRYGNKLGPVLPPLMDYTSPNGNELGPVLPSLMAYSPYGSWASPAVSESVHMSFSNPVSSNASGIFAMQDQASWGDSTCWSMGSLEPSEN